MRSKLEGPKLSSPELAALVNEITHDLETQYADCRWRDILTPEARAVRDNAILDYIAEIS